MRHPDGHGTGCRGGGDPRQRVLDGNAVGDVDAEQIGGPQIRLRVGFGVRDAVARDHHVERIEWNEGPHVLGHDPDRHGHESRRHARFAQRAQKLPGTRSPWHALADTRHHDLGELRDDLVCSQFDAVLLQDERASFEAGPDQRHGIFVRPGSAETGNHAFLGAHPIGLGIDDGSVHVPENGGRQACLHVEAVYGGGSPG